MPNNTYKNEFCLTFVKKKNINIFYIGVGAGITTKPEPTPNGSRLGRVPVETLPIAIPNPFAFGFIK